MLSAVVLAKNEEENIKGCLCSLKFCDEILVVDDYSTDKTREIAQKLGAKVFLHPLNNNFAQQRNFGLRKAKGEWVLFVDADERVTKGLALEIKEKIEKIRRSRKKTGGFYIKRRDFVLGKWLKFGETGRIKLLRLARKKNGAWQGQVHEVWRVKGALWELKNSLLHFPHPTVSQFLEKINQYSTIWANELYQKGKKTNFVEILIYPLGKFLKNFFWYLGFLDGLAGFLHALFMSFHSFLVRGKLWLLWRRRDKMARDRM